LPGGLVDRPGWLIFSHDVVDFDYFRQAPVPGVDFEKQSAIIGSRKEKGL
jgi:hypothetical protein